MCDKNDVLKTSFFVTQHKFHLTFREFSSWIIVKFCKMMYDSMKNFKKKVRCFFPKRGFPQHFNSRSRFQCRSFFFLQRAQFVGKVLQLLFKVMRRPLALASRSCRASSCSCGLLCDSPGKRPSLSICCMRLSAHCACSVARCMDIALASVAAICRSSSSKAIGRPWALESRSCRASSCSCSSLCDSCGR